MTGNKNYDWRVEFEWRITVDHQPLVKTVEVVIDPPVLEGLVVGMDVPEVDLALIKTFAERFGVVDHVARAYQHQVNIIDVAPIDTSGRAWRYYPDPL